jgi:hypothetical protein
MASTNTFLTLVKSTNAYISQFVGNTADPCFTKGLLESSPTIYKSGNSFFIDYSASANSSDLKFTKRFFGSLTVGNTFAISCGTYFIESTGQQLSFSGTYTLSGITGAFNQYVNATGVTYSTSLSDGVYANNNFSAPLNYTAITGITAQYFISKLNKTDPYNIEFLGIYGNDYGYEEYLEVIGSSSNALRYRINSPLKLNNGSEIVYLNNQSTVTNENLYFVPVTINVYMRGIPDLITLSQNKNVNGLLKILNSDGTTLKILNNQNLYQRYCRGIADSSNYYDWYATHRTSNFENIYNPYSWDGLSLSINYYSFIKIGTSTVFVTTESSIDTAETQTNTNILIVDGVQTNYASYVTQSTVSNPTLKLDLSDSSLYGASIEPYTDFSCSVPLTDSYFLNGVAGFDGSSFIYLKTNTAPASIFLKFKRETEMILQIVI